ncbi:MAG TPA: L,D-transpeptidase family protein [Flavobacterium sp.]
MKNFKYLQIAALLLLFLAVVSCKKDPAKAKADKFTVDSLQLDPFFNKHPEFADYKKDILALYIKHNYKYVWYDKDGRNDFADVLYDRASQIELEGVPQPLPYKDKLEEIFDDDRKKPNLEKELLISSMYFFYAKKVYDGLDPQKSKQLGWYLPRDRMSYVDYLDELMEDSDLLKKDQEALPQLYYNLRRALQKYRQIRDSGGWGTIALPAGTKSLRPGDNSPAVAQLRRRFAVTGELGSDNRSTVYDQSLVDVVKAWQIRQNIKSDGIVGPQVIAELNKPVEERIKTILVNMERCRWLSADIGDLKEAITVNVPSYRMRYTRDGKTRLESNVVVGKELNKTVIFSGKMSYLVFSPYWNVPKSIIKDEIEPAMAQNPNYLEEHNMEWNDGNVRQRPGADNSLGLVKFMFPNRNNIYLHDTPAKSLFKKDDRALSHGCVRVEKARDLAVAILEGDRNWDAQKIDEAMHGGEEKQYALKRKIPVYISYFTATADQNGIVSFFDDVYKRDERLAHMLYTE